MKQSVSLNDKCINHVISKYEIVREKKAHAKEIKVSTAFHLTKTLNENKSFKSISVILSERKIEISKYLRKTRKHKFCVNLKASS